VLQKLVAVHYLVQGTSGAEIIEELKPCPNEYIVERKRFSGFFQSDLLMILMRLKVTSLVISGIQTPNCIRATVSDAISYDFDVTVLEDATSAQTPEIHQANVFDMLNMGAHVKTVKEFFQQ
jgi:nicotinamidase-related amidase